ncbi:MAG: glycerophosphodiester phosphodiesterase [Bacteroidetes bacterium]|nr:MAG: glycerophosphodiester phosphodiesterase [Bacteroidota bacterium]
MMILIHLVVSYGDCQVFIHAHNDYEKPDPLFTALKNKVYSVEADVFLRNGKLFVAHSADKIDSNRTIQSLYLNPIESLFKKNHGFISEDSSYVVTLMIDVKDSGKSAIEELAKIIEPIKKEFNRNLNSHAVKIVISGERGKAEDWNNYPDYIYFDGRPYETYSSGILNRIAFVSDNYWNYVSFSDQDNWTRLNEVIQKVHSMGKLIRLWATPDTDIGWAKLHDAKVDIINTDKPHDCAEFFRKSQ